MRLGRIGYINCYPVYGAIDRGVTPLAAELVTGTPSELNDLLAAGELDLSVVSAVEYARNARDYVLLPHVAISCDGPVRSVALFSRRPVGQLDDRTVLLTASSRTAVGQLELLCRDVWKVRPHFAQARAEAADLAVEYARNARDYVLLPHLAISCDGPVRSVALFSRRPVGQLDDRTVLLTASSRTAVGLLELLYRDVWKVRPHFAQARAEAADLDGLAHLPHEAVLVIGDAALLLAARHAYPHRYDLGEEWKRWTGLPFVFATWAARRAADPRAVRAVHHTLLAARDWGLAHLDLLADAAARASGVGVTECRSYLAGLDYALTDTHLAGLTDFFRRLAARGLVPDGSLQFLQVA